MFQLITIIIKKKHLLDVKLYITKTLSLPSKSLKSRAKLDNTPKPVKTNSASAFNKHTYEVSKRTRDCSIFSGFFKYTEVIFPSSPDC